LAGDYTSAASSKQHAGDKVIAAVMDRRFGATTLTTPANTHTAEDEAGKEKHTWHNTSRAEHSRTGMTLIVFFFFRST
jgi:hypothetical protein